ncbi:hypothetical protein NC651_034753 [Populus alba x Populus x berolinensis]|nr:hypothetical protein NC651_034753 [Populus alba x Populus x berolinensis]
MAKLYLKKLFPKLVSSLAVLLLLCQFGYVACQPTGVFIPSRNATLPEGEEIGYGDWLRKGKVLAPQIRLT